ncbi:MAG: GAF domain-containing protein [Pontixanthobacter sp.]
MYDFSADPTLSKAENYASLCDAAAALVAGETDRVANMANIAALLWDFLPHVNWTGFYRLIDDTLVLGPFQGRPACIRIAIGEGVCGTAISSKETQLVADVHAFPGHIACDATTQSELVVPVWRSGVVCGVIDLDSPTKGRFDREDAAGIEKLARALDGFV